jgi:hypothetical protein
VESASADRRRALGLGVLATLLYLATAPGVVNPDGLGYLKLIPHNFAAGHLLYMPLLRLATSLLHGNGLEAGRLCNALLGGSGVVLFFGIVRRMAGDAGLLAADARFAATLASAGLALSYGYWVQGADVEAYAAAMVALLTTVRLVLAHQRRPTLPRALAVGASLGGAVLFHLTHVCLTPLVLLALGRARRLHAIAAVILGGAISLLAYAYAALLVRGHDLHAAIAWVSTASHGFPAGGGAYRLSDAIYGLCKSVIWSPYLYEADAQKLIGQFLLGLLPIVGLAVWLRKNPGLDGKLALAWVAPYALLGVAFFGSDSERWLFILPVGWLYAGVLAASSGAAAGRSTARRAQLGAAILAYVGLLNFATAMWPAHRDLTIQRRAERASLNLRDGDTVIFPGHSWDEYVAFYAHARVWPVPLVYYLARDGADEGWQRFEREVAATMMRGGRLYTVRIFDDDEDPRGWSELLQLGLTREQVRARITNGLTAVPEGSLVRLDPKL